MFAAFALPSVAKATPQDIGGTVTFDVSAKPIRTITGLTFAPKEPLHDFLFKGVTATPVALGGFDQYGNGAIGGELVFDRPFSREFAIDVGFGGVAIQGSKSHLLVSLGLSKRF